MTSEVQCDEGEDEDGERRVEEEKSTDDKVEYSPSKHNLSTHVKMSMSNFSDFEFVFIAF